MNPKAFGTIGVLNRAGLLAFGEAALHGRYPLFLLALDASENTAKRVKGKAAHDGSTLILVGSKEELGEPLGYPELAFVAVKDAKAARSLAQKLEEKGDNP